MVQEVVQEVVHQEILEVRVILPQSVHLKETMVVIVQVEVLLKLVAVVEEQELLELMVYQQHQQVMVVMVLLYLIRFLVRRHHLMVLLAQHQVQDIFQVVEEVEVQQT